MGSLQILCVFGFIVFNNAERRYGVCPPSLRPVIFCEPRMSDCSGIGNDSDCPGTTMKCCPGDCEEFKCKEPKYDGRRALRKAGTCPVPPRFDPDFCARALFLKGCDNDDDCLDTKQKCCVSGICHVPNCVDTVEESRRKKYIIT